MYIIAPIEIGNSALYSLYLDEVDMTAYEDFMLPRIDPGSGIILNEMKSEAENVQAYLGTGITLEQAATKAVDEVKQAHYKLITAARSGNFDGIAHNYSKSKKYPLGIVGDWRFKVYAGDFHRIYGVHFGSSLLIVTEGAFKAVRNIQSSSGLMACQGRLNAFVSRLQRVGFKPSDLNVDDITCIP